LICFAGFNPSSFGGLFRVKGWVKRRVMGWVKKNLTRPVNPVLVDFHCYNEFPVKHPSEKKLNFRRERGAS